MGVRGEPGPDGGAYPTSRALPKPALASPDAYGWPPGTFAPGNHGFSSGLGVFPSLTHFGETSGTRQRPSEDRRVAGAALPGPERLGSPGARRLPAEAAQRPR